MDELISREKAIEALQEHRNIFCDNTPETFSKLSYAEKSRVDELDMAIATLINLPSAQPDSKELSFTQKKLDTISRQAAINALTSHIMPHNNEDGTVTIGVLSKSSIKNILNKLPSAQPETHEERTETHACDLISRQAAIDAILAVTGNSSVRELYEHVQEHGLSDMWSVGVNAAIDIIIAVPSAQPELPNSCYTNSWCIDCKEYDTENKCCPRYNRVIKQTLDDAYRHGETEAEARFHAQQMWIPCSERLPEFKYETYDADDDYTFWDTDFVIGATSRGTLSIGQFTRDSDKPNEFHWDACECDAFDLQGCLRIGDHIIAWMPLPESYTEDKG